MFIEYANLIGGNIGLDSQTLTETALILFSGLILTGGGYAVKGMWGAVAAFGMGVIGYLYWKQMLPF